MRLFGITILVAAFATHGALAELPSPITTLDGTDDVERLIKGYPEEKYGISSTLCGLKPTPEFRDGYMIALRLWHLGAEPHYLVYPESDKIPESYLPLKTLTLTNYKHTARLLEAIRGFNYSMAMRAYDAKYLKLQKKANKLDMATPRKPSD